LCNLYLDNLHLTAYNLRRFIKNSFFANSGDILIFSKGFIKLESCTTLLYGIAYGSIKFEDFLKPKFIGEILGVTEVVIIILNNLGSIIPELFGNLKITNQHYKDYLGTIAAKKWTIWPLNPVKQLLPVIDIEESLDEVIYGAFSSLVTRKSARKLLELDIIYPKLLEVSELCFKMKHTYPFTFYLKIKEMKYNFETKLELVIATLIMIQIDPERTKKLVLYYSDIEEFAKHKGGDSIEAIVKLCTFFLSKSGPQIEPFELALKEKILVLEKIPEKNVLRSELIKDAKWSMYFPQLVQLYLKDLDYFGVLRSALDFKTLISLFRHYLILSQANPDYYESARKIIWLLRLSISHVNVDHLKELKMSFPDVVAYNAWTLLIEYCGNKCYRRMSKRGLEYQLKFQDMSSYRHLECPKEDEKQVILG
jgi:hypothetical protein